MTYDLEWLRDRLNRNLPDREIDFLLYAWFHKDRDLYMYRKSKSRGWLRIRKDFPGSSLLMSTGAPYYTSDIGAALSLQAADQQLEIRSPGRGREWQVYSRKTAETWGQFPMPDSQSYLHCAVGLMLPVLLAKVRVTHEMEHHYNTPPEIIGGSEVYE